MACSAILFGNEIDKLNYLVPSIGNGGEGILKSAFIEEYTGEKMRGPSQRNKISGVILGIALLAFSSGIPVSSDLLAAAPIQIMLLGDSITDGVGSADGSGYRRLLYHMLTTHGYSIRFVGNQANGPYDYDRKHEGHSGYTAEQIRQNIYLENGDWLGKQPADIILLHIGTNDISQGIQNVSKINDILNKIDLFEQNTGRAVTVILARIIQRAESDPGYQPTFEFNNAIENLALSRISAGDRLILVDMEGALNPSSDLIDVVHPNDSGYRKMAAVWLDAVTRVLPQGEQFFGQYIPQDIWLMHYVDSEETVGENGEAENAFDGDPTTIWHTKWFGGIDPLPHQLQIDLGQVYSIDGLRYLPRQDKQNGRIADFQIYVSSNGTTWGSAVAQGRFPNTAVEQTVTFPKVLGRYIRIVATSEVVGHAFVAIAELNATQSIQPAANYPPNGSITQPIKNLKINIGEQVDFSGSGSDADQDSPLTYRWSFGPGSGIPDSTVADPAAIRFNNPGVFEVRLTVCDSLGLCDPTPATRTVTVGTVSGVLPRSGWSVAYVDSQEQIGENGAAANVFDGNANTIWHSEWFQQLTPLPHEIRIDLGGRYTVTGFKYLPRQNMANGRIADYAFYVSEDGVVWGSAVAQGRFPNVAAEQTVSFSEATGRYVRLVALSEVNGNPITSVAELNVLGYAASGGGNQAPNGAIDSPPGNLTVPVGGSVDFRGSGSDPDGNLPLSYAWNFGDPGIPASSVEDPGLVTFPNAGTYTVRFTVTDALGLSDPTPATRTVTVGTVSGVLPRSGWSVAYVDSQEQIGENGAAANVFDGNANTIWHSEWFQQLTPLPHEIRIDLGAQYTLTGFRYLPRQGATINGQIANYEFYVSLDGVNWGSAVASGTFPNTSAEQTVNFTNVPARFVRLRALSEVNGNPITSVAELNVLGLE
jgi:lysophospholipase L1-like esterase